MGALAPIWQWSPEDDLKLKNAVEAGASLESLAKGAVQFSRRFTVQELRERWHSLLYDPFVSAEAASIMFEFERSASSLPLKASRYGNAKENVLPGKRKAESVRSCYYAMRKRICKEPFNSMDLSFLVAQDDNNCFGNADEPPSANCMLGDPMSNHFGFQQPNLDTMHHSFPQIVMDDTAPNSVGHAYHTGLHNAGENGFPAEQNSIQEDISHVLGENQCLVGNCCRVEEMGQSKELPVCNMYEAGDLEAKCSSSFDHINNDSGNLCSGFGGTQVFNSPISDCGASFHNLGYSSPLPEMPIWRTIEGISALDMPVDLSIAEEDHCRRDEFALPDDGDAKHTSTSGFDAGHTDSKLKNQIPCDEFKCSSTEGYLEELSNSLLNFTNDEELIFMNVDGKDVIDKSYYDGLTSLLLNSPSDINQDHMPNITEPEVPPDSYLAITDGPYPGESKDNGEPSHVDGHIVAVSEIQIPSSTSSLNSQNPEMRDGVICCTLNTEDQEIPLNDDVILPKQMLSSLSTASQKNCHDGKNRSFPFVKDLLENKKHSESVPTLMTKEGKDLGQSHVSSKVTGTRGLPGMGLHHPSGCGLQIEFPKDDALHGVSRGASVTFRVPNQINSANVSTKAVLPKILKEESIETELEKHLFNSVDSFQEEPANGSDSFKSHPWTNANCSIPEIDVPTTNQNHQPLHVEMGSIDVAMEEIVANPSTSDQEELPFDDDDSVPPFSDVEAVVLDRDLDPDDPDVHFSAEVSKYHDEDSKRDIIRLEQSEKARMQREIASHGAFAVLHGRHLKHFINKPEVSLGRATEDIIVDIDLGREGCANKISRRQAIMKMDDLGNFYLKNLGKRSIFINDKEVASGQSRTLNSDCVIKIREMSFIFETNQTCVKQYMDNISSRSHTQEHKF